MENKNMKTHRSKYSHRKFLDGGYDSRWIHHKLLLCGKSSRRSVTTYDDSLITCPRCLEILKNKN